MVVLGSLLASSSRPKRGIVRQKRPRTLTTSRFERRIKVGPNFCFGRVDQQRSGRGWRAPFAPLRVEHPSTVAVLAPFDQAFSSNARGLPGGCALIFLRQHRLESGVYIRLNLEDLPGLNVETHEGSEIV